MVARARPGWSVKSGAPNRVRKIKNFSERGLWFGVKMSVVG